jgi:hypothetical protein
MADAFGISATFRLTWRYRTYEICDEDFKLKIVAILFDLYLKETSTRMRGDSSVALPSSLNNFPFDPLSFPTQPTKPAVTKWLDRWNK